MSDSIKSLAKCIIAIALIIYLILSGQLDFKLLLSAQHNEYLVFAFGLLSLNILFMTIRWQILIQALGVMPRFLDIFKLNLISLFFNYTLLGSIGGDVVKSYLLSKDYDIEKNKAFGSVLIDRTIGLFVMLALAGVSLIWSWEFTSKSAKLITLTTLIWIFFFVGILLVFLFTRPRLVHFFKDKKIFHFNLGWISELLILFQLYKKYKIQWVYSIGLSLAAQICDIYFFACAGWALGYNLPMSVYFFAVPVGFTLMAIPLSPGGIGVGQVVFLTLFQIFLRDSTPVGQLGISVFQIMLIGWGGVGAVVYLTRSHKSKKLEVMQ